MQIWRKGSFYPTGRRTAILSRGERTEKQDEAGGVRLWARWPFPPLPLGSNPGNGGWEHSGGSKTPEHQDWCLPLPGCGLRSCHTLQRSPWVLLTPHPAQRPAMESKWLRGELWSIGPEMPPLVPNVWASLKCGGGPEVPVYHRGSQRVARVLAGEFPRTPSQPRASALSCERDFSTEGQMAVPDRPQGTCSFQESQARHRQPGSLQPCRKLTVVPQDLKTHVSSPCNRLLSWNEEGTENSCGNGKTQRQVITQEEMAVTQGSRRLEQQEQEFLPVTEMDPQELTGIFQAAMFSLCIWANSTFTGYSWLL